MTTQEPPGEQPPQYDTALLTTALNHYWAWYDGGNNRAFQILNYYLVATAILFTAFTSAINNKHYGLAAALSIAALGVTALTAAAVFGQTGIAGRAQPGLTELQNLMAGTLIIKPIPKATVQPEGTPIPEATVQARMPWRRVAVVALTFGLAALFQIGGLLYALIH
jgi:hypothetical protein